MSIIQFLKPIQNFKIISKNIVILLIMMINHDNVPLIGMGNIKQVTICHTFAFTIKMYIEDIQLLFVYYLIIYIENKLIFNNKK